MNQIKYCSVINVLKINVKSLDKFNYENIQIGQAAF